ncbi:MAG TPA: GreA/GreB family elongation factor [Brumimicrobium sp.]|nr:GreA/GreB family elongation factor [Brumimicrobium sp.]
MSRGFVREGDQEEAPVIPSRAALPDNTPNYVTPEGFAALKTEKIQLLEELSSFESTDEHEKRRKAAEIDGKLNLLNERINSARVLDAKDQAMDEVRFGATVTYKIDTAKSPVTLKIVGVDEADIKEKKIAFIAPIAKAMIGKKEGELTKLSLGGEEREVKIIKITYPSSQE